MTHSIKTIALIVAFTAQAIAVTASPSHALTFNFPDVSFPDAQSGQGCHFYGTCDAPQSVDNPGFVSTSGFENPDASPERVHKSDR